MGILSFFKQKDDISYLLGQLNNQSGEKRDAAIKKLENMQIKVDEGLKILEAAKNSFPPAKYEWQDISAQLIDICANKPYIEYISKVEAIYEQLNPNAKMSVFHFLSKYENEYALITYLKLLEKDYEKLQRLPSGSLNNKPRFPQIIFPKLLKFCSNKEISSDIYYVLLSYINKGLVNEGSLSEYKEKIVDDILDMANQVCNYVSEEGVMSIWDDDNYLVLRCNAGIYFDLAGYIKDARIILALKNLMNVKDMRLKMFAALSLLKHGCHLESKDALDIAASSEVRNWFYEGLMKIGKSEIFPVEYMNQNCFAEADMVNWLIYPTELGRVPDEIELMNVFDDGEEVYYLFRYRCDSDENWRENGWMAGISGPFNKKNSPTTSAEGHTFSHFEKWESKTPEEHFSSIVGNVKEFWMKWASEVNETE